MESQSANPSSSNPLFYEDLSSENPLQQQASFPLSTGMITHMDWNPEMMLDNLTFIEEKIRQLKSVIRSMVDSNVGGEVSAGELVQQQQQQVVNTDLTCLIVQLISTAGSLLPSLKNSTFLSHLPAAAGHLMDNLAGSSSSLVLPNGAVSENHKEEISSPDYEELFKGFNDGIAAIDSVLVEEHDTKDGDIAIGSVLVEEHDGKDVYGGAMDSSSYELLQLEREEILAPHTHFCSICGKGFKRDANLRMHMRGHGDEYKSSAALAKPPRDTGDVNKRYSCPFAGCKRNKLHSGFQPLKTFLCVKNHYKRSHCEKLHVCGRCHAKKFSVMADLRTHEKHCGRVRWVCSCGTSFSRKDKLFAHVALFKGHSPALLPPQPVEVCGEIHGESSPAAAKVASSSMAVGSSSGGGSSFMWGADNAVSSDGIEGLSNGGGGDDFLLTAANFGGFDFGLGQFDAFQEDHSDGSLEMLHSEQFGNNGES